MRKTCIIAITGKSGSGKDTLKQALLKKYPDKLHNIITMTTRPIRDCEKDGIDYHFKTEAEVSQLLFEDKLLEAKVFNNWFYGTGLDALSDSKINIGVYNLEGVETLHQSGFDVFSVYIDEQDKVRLIRYLNREQSPDIDEMFRRYRTDERDFEGYEDTVNYSVSYDEALDLLSSVIEEKVLSYE